MAHPAIVLSFFLFTLSSISSFELYRDGLHFSNFISEEQNVLNINHQFLSVDTQHLFNKLGPILDVHHSGSEIALFLVVGMNLKTSEKDASTSTFLHPYIQLIDNNVSAVGSYLDAVNTNLFYFAFRREIDNKLCTGVINAVDFSQTHDCFAWNAPGIVKKIEMATTGKLFVLFDDGSLRRVDISGTNISISAPIFVNVKLFSFPLVYVEGDSSLYYIEDIKSPVDLVGRVPIALANNRYEDNFVLQYDNGLIRGYGFQYVHPAFTNDCPIINEGSCTLKSSDMTHQGIKYSTHMLLHNLPNNKVRLYLESGYEDIPVQLNSAEILHIISKSLSAFMLLYSDGSTTMARGLYKDSPLTYSLTPKLPNSKELEFLGKYDDVLNVYISYTSYYYLLKNGQVKSSDNITLLEDIKTCSIKMTTDRTLCLGLDNQLYVDFAYINLSFLSGKILKIGHSDNFRNLYVMEENRAWYFGPLPGSSRGNAEVEDIYFGSDIVVLKKHNEFYCGFGDQVPCCNRNLDEAKKLMVSSEVNTVYLYPIDKGGLGNQTVKDISIVEGHIIFLANDGSVYACDMDQGTMGRDERIERGSVVEKESVVKGKTVDNLTQDRSYRQDPSSPIYSVDFGISLPNDPICSITPGLPFSNVVYMTSCKDRSVYYYGIRPNTGYSLSTEGVLLLSDEWPAPAIQKLDTLGPNKRIKWVIGSAIGAYMAISDDECSDSNCIIDEVIADDEVVVLPNSTVIVVSGPSTITNSTLVIEHGTTIIIQDTFVITNSTFVYHIPNEDIWDSIKDRDQILIIDTDQGGQIEGSFENVVLDIGERMETCKNISATIETIKVEE